MIVLSTKTDMFRVGDDIPIKITLTNVNTNQDVAINKRLAPNDSFAPGVLRDIVFEILAPSGGNLTLGFVNVLPLDAGDFTLLHPGDAYSDTLVLQDYYLLDEVGVYSIRAIYHNETDPGGVGAVWKGTIASNSVSLSIVP